MSNSKAVKNFFFPVTQNTEMYRKPMGGPAMKKNLSYYISPVQFARIRNDIGLWREAIVEAELAWYPHRVKMQRIFQDTVLNEHVEACMKKRRRLTLLRDFKICDAKGKADEDLKLFFTQKWFADFQSYALDALFYGYSLISFGDLVQDNFPDLSIVRRQNVSPDRLNVSSMVYMLSGEYFMEEPYRKWHVWVPTSSELGVSPCGYGLLYKIAKTEIYLRNNTAFNADGIEIFGQPIRKGKTTKTDEGERGAFETALRNMGSSAYILLDDGQDELELVESKNSGTGYMIYGDFEKRQEAKISKVLLGHADALESTPGKLGSGQGEQESPVQTALNEIQAEDGKFTENIINNQLLPRLRTMGLKIPIDKHFEFENKKEQQQARAKEDSNNLVTATVAKTMKDAGLVYDPVDFEQRTGIKTTTAPEPVVVPPTNKPGDKKPLSETVKNKLEKLYK